MTHLDTYNGTEWYSCAETAAVIRTVLKGKFPGVKFSVRSKTYSGGASIDISWTDGPTTKEVDAATSHLESKGFDGSIDMAYGKRQWRMPDGTIVFAGTSGTQGSMGMFAAIEVAKPHPDAAPVRMGADYIFTNRHYSASFIDKNLPAVCKKYGIPTLAVETYKGNTAHWYDYWLDDTGCRQYLDNGLRHWINDDLTSISI